MSFDGHAASSSGCAIKPRARGTGSTAFVGRTGTFLRTGSYGNGRASGSRVTRECHARFWERLGVRDKSPAGRFVGTAEVPQKTDGTAAARILEGIASRACGDIPRLLLVLSRVKQTTHPKETM